ncbi:MAG: 1-deoxy-D-xylulose-5-phosphate reductoisomerase [Firmicutes bacterium]|nr:1-deoxy-D-xylulose-5-phosphate reductoisomerase [Bacillota bacterium]
MIILGSTGSIGTQALDVVRRMPDRFRVVGLAAGSNVELLAKQIEEFRPKTASLASDQGARRLKERNFPDLEILTGPNAMEEMVKREDVDLVLNAVVGAAGILPTLAAIRAGKDVALANKETLVAAGSVVMDAVREHNVRLLPVDSEHSAIFQCLQGVGDRDLHKVILTASGGPFRESTKDELERVTVEEALAHPTWNMGGKITIDSATLMNKGLEVIEAHWLFQVPPDRIEVVIHPQSIVHSLVELSDGSVIAQLGVADMRLPIQYALTFPERLSSPVERLSLTEVGRLDFEAPDAERFPCLPLAYEALAAGGTFPTVLNAANEVAVQAFMQGRIGFTDIPRLIEAALEQHQGVMKPDLEDILEADAEGREYLFRMLGV